jgi:hypothetical protein
MARLSNNTTSQLFDMGNYPEVYVDGIGAIDQYGPNSQIVFYAVRRVDDRTQRMIGVRLIVPTAELARMARQLTEPNAAIDGPASNSEHPETGESLLH